MAGESTFSRLNFASGDPSSPIIQKRKRASRLIERRTYASGSCSATICFRLTETLGLERKGLRKTKLKCRGMGCPVFLQPPHQQTGMA